MRRLALASVLAAAAAGCFDDEGVQKLQETFAATGTRPDELPVMLNTELPFRYPPALYAQKAQGNVTLRIFIDRNGRVAPESTRVEQTSGYPPLDSAAVTGTQELSFVPAKKGGEPIAVSILFPVYFRHPEAPALPGDTILDRAGVRTNGGRPAAPGAAPRPAPRP